MTVNNRWVLYHATSILAWLMWTFIICSRGLHALSQHRSIVQSSGKEQEVAHHADEPMYKNWWRGPALDSPLSQVRASPGLTTQVMEPSPLTKCLDILQYEASLPTGILSIYLCIALSDKKNPDFIQISLLERKRQIKLNFQVS